MKVLTTGLPGNSHKLSDFLDKRVLLLFLDLSSDHLTRVNTESKILRDFYPWISWLLKHLEICVHQSCLTLCNPMNCSLPSSSVHGILQARILERVAIPSPGNIPDPGIKLRSPALQVDSLPSETPRKFIQSTKKRYNWAHFTNECYWNIWILVF